jgi:hypothetical protein
MTPLELLRVLELDDLVVENITYGSPSEDRVTVVFRRPRRLFMPGPIIPERRFRPEPFKQEVKGVPGIRSLKQFNKEWEESGAVGAGSDEPLISPEGLEKISKELRPEAARVLRKAEDKLRELGGSSLSCSVEGCEFTARTFQGLQVHKARAHKKSVDNGG